MKKVLLITLVAGISFSSCKKAGVDPLLSCDKAAEDFTAKLMAFFAAQTQKNCEAYVDSAKQYLKSCTILTAAEKKDLENDLNDTNCKDL